MILVNVYVAETNEAYDFRVDSSMPLGQLTDDLVGQVAQRTHRTLQQHGSGFLLCRRGTGELFNRTNTLADYGVHSGDDLMLV